MNVEHATTVSASSTLFAVVSIASVVNVVRPMRNLVIEVANVHVHRFFPDGTLPALTILSTGLSLNSGSSFNVTAVVNLFDATSTITLANPSLLFAIQIVYASSGGAPPAVIHTNSTTTLRNNCTATYTNSVMPDVSDSVALVMLPSASYNCSYDIKDTFLPGRSIGGVAGALGPAALVNSTVHARNVHGLSMLLHGAYKPIQLTGANTKLQFEEISLQSIYYGRDMQHYAIGTQSTAINAELQTIPPIAPSSMLLTATPKTRVSFINITRCTFQGFTALLMPSAVNVIHPPFQPPFAMTTLLELGCNVWEDGSRMRGGLPGDLVSTNASIVPYIHYPPSRLNASIACRGFQGAVSVSQTLHRTYCSTCATASGSPTCNGGNGNDHCWNCWCRCRCVFRVGGCSSSRRPREVSMRPTSTARGHVRLSVPPLPVLPLVTTRWCLGTWACSCCSTLCIVLCYTELV